FEWRYIASLPFLFTLFAGGAWLAYYLIFWLTLRLTHALAEPVDLTSTVRVAQSLTADRRNAMTQGFIVVSLLCLPIILFALDTRLFGLEEIAILMSGYIAFGLFLWLAIVSPGTAWGQWLVLGRFWLPLTGRLPWRVMTFLDDA